MTPRRAVVRLTPPAGTQPCPACGGAGYRRGDHGQPCPYCDRGLVLADEADDPREDDW